MMYNPPPSLHRPETCERLVITGSRDWTNRPFLYGILDRIYDVRPFDVLIHGDARGVDRMGRDWAIENGIAVMKFPANWTKHGKSAGPIRNGEMIEKGHPTIAAAFPLNDSIGTWDMVRKLDVNDIPILYLHGKGWSHV